MALVIVEKGDTQDVAKRLSLSDKPLFIGRPTPDSMPDIPLGDDYVSRRLRSCSVRASFRCGTYVAALRATSHRQGDPDTPYARVQNLGRVQVVVR